MPQDQERKRDRAKGGEDAWSKMSVGDWLTRTGQAKSFGGDPRTGAAAGRAVFDPYEEVATGAGAGAAAGRQMVGPGAGAGAMAGRTLAGLDAQRAVDDANALASWYEAMAYPTPSPEQMYLMYGDDSANLAFDGAGPGAVEGEVGRIVAVHEVHLLGGRGRVRHRLVPAGERVRVVDRPLRVEAGERPPGHRPGAGTGPDHLAARRGAGTGTGRDLLVRVEHRPARRCTGAGVATEALGLTGAGQPVADRHLRPGVLAALRAVTLAFLILWHLVIQTG